MLQHDHDVLALAYHPNGKLLATATLDAQIYLWNPMEAELQVVPILICCVAQWITPECSMLQSISC